MIIFDKLWVLMKNEGVTTYVLREKYGFDSRTIRRLKSNANTTTDTLSRLCDVLGCDIGDICENKNNAATEK